MATIIEGQPDVSTTHKKVQTIVMTNGILIYILDELPESEFAIQCFINGVEVTFTLDGVNLTITEYTAGTIETGWDLKVYYFKVV